VLYACKGVDIPFTDHWESVGVLYASKGAHTFFSGLREIYVEYGYWILGPVKVYTVISVFLAISMDIHFAKKGLNRLEQVPNPSLGSALALALILAPNN
jgi:hypothetical protein